MQLFRRTNTGGFLLRPYEYGNQKAQQNRPTSNKEKVKDQILIGPKVFELASGNSRLAYANIAALAILQRK